MPAIVLDEAAVARLYRIKRDLEDFLDQVNATPEPLPAPETSIFKGTPVAVIVGHSAKSPGAYGKPPIDTNEYQWNKDLAARMASLAPARGLDLHVLTRDNGGVVAAYTQAAQLGAVAIVELHFNAATSPTATGTETIYDAPHDIPLAKLCQAAMVKALGLADRGIQTPWEGRGEANDDAAQHIPSVIVEPFFGSNAADCQRAHERKAQLAVALTDALAEFVRARA